MKKKNITNSIIALSILALLGGGILAVSAHGLSRSFNSDTNNANTHANPSWFTRHEGMMMSNDNLKDRDSILAKRDTVQQALAQGDYQTWLKAVGENSEITQKITAKNFPELVKAYQLRQEAQQIMLKLGLNQGEAGEHSFGFRGMGHHFMMN